MTGGRRLIAVVDDELAFRKAIARLLRVRGQEVVTFASGLDFLDYMQTQRPDCVLLDVHVPGLSGFEIQRRLADAGIDLPMVLITGKDEPEFRDRAIAAGAAAYLLKPLDEQDLMNAIDLAIREWTATHGQKNLPQNVEAERRGWK
jgi:FixJ family two-component response regulator